MQPQNLTRINKDGLRYQSKSNGSPFGTAIGHTLSCIKRGNHRSRSLLQMVMLAGTRQYKCKDNCGVGQAAGTPVAAPDNGVEL